MDTDSTRAPRRPSRRATPRWLALAALLALIAMQALTPGTEAATAQRIAVPSYFYPGPTWTPLLAAAPNVGLAIINPASGPGDKADPAYVTQVAAARRAGVTVLGYVTTNYAKPDRPLDKVTGEIDRYFSLYGVGDIFLDEVVDYPSAAQLAYYQALSAHIRKVRPAAKVVLNPGKNADARYLSQSIADIIVTFEGTYATYQGYTSATWTTAYPADRFWHLIHTTGSAKDMRDAVALSRKNRAGWIYVTPDTMADDNPWDTLPPAPYWEAELAAVQPLPDLLVDTWTADRDAIGYYVRITILNRGGGAASSTTLRYKSYAGGYDFGLATVPALAPNASTILTFRGTPCQIVGPELIVDVFGQVREWREDNNTTWALHTC